MSETAVVDNAARSRFELAEDGGVSFADYHRHGDRLAVTHVETPDAMRGRGTAGRLMEGIVAHARAEGLKIAPICSYAAAWMRRHPQHGDLLA